MIPGGAYPGLEPGGEGGPAPQPNRTRRALIRALVLVALTLCAFREEAMRVLAQAATMVQAAHALALPVLAALLVYCRREALAGALRRGSGWGALLIALAVAAYAVTTWPFYLSYMRKLQFVTAFAGIALVVGGWRVLWRCLPILFLVALAIPIGWNTYSTLVIQPETMTMEAAARLLDAWPGAIVELHGTELRYIRAGLRGAVGLGDTHGGCMAPMALLALYLFVVFARVRPWWQVMALLVMAVPATVLCNLLRVLLHAGLTMATGAWPTDGLPRDAAMLLSLLAVYLLAGLGALLLDRVIVEVDGTGAAPAECGRQD